MFQRDTSLSHAHKDLSSCLSTSAQKVFFLALLWSIEMQQVQITIASLRKVLFSCTWMQQVFAATKKICFSGLSLPIFLVLKATPSTHSCFYHAVAINADFVLPNSSSTMSHIPTNLFHNETELHSRCGPHKIVCPVHILRLSTLSTKRSRNQTHES